jgi:hypothetical protein
MADPYQAQSGWQLLPPSRKASMACPPFAEGYRTCFRTRADSSLGSTPLLMRNVTSHTWTAAELSPGTGGRNTGEDCFGGHEGGLCRLLPQRLLVGCKAPQAESTRCQPIHQAVEHKTVGSSAHISMDSPVSVTSDPTGSFPSQGASGMRCSREEMGDLTALWHSVTQPEHNPYRALPAQDTGASLRSVPATPALV